MTTLTNRFNTILAWLPAYTVLIYICGYVIMNAYLKQFEINEVSSIDIRHLKSGILFAIIVFPPILLCFRSFKFNDYSNSSGENFNILIHDLHNAYGYGIIYSLSLGNILFGLHWNEITIYLLCVLALSFILNKIDQSKRWLIYAKMTILMFTLFGVLHFFVFKNIDASSKFYFLIFSSLFPIIFLRIFIKEDSTYQFSKYIGLIVTLLFSLNFFGAYLIKDVPSQYGGELKKRSKYYFAYDSIEKLKKTDLKMRLMCFDNENLELVYETSERFYFKISKDKIINIPKSFIDFEQISLDK